MFWNDSDGCTALTYAASSGHMEIVKLLIDHGANIEARDAYNILFNIKD